MEIVTQKYYLRKLQSADEQSCSICGGRLTARTSKTLLFHVRIDLLIKSNLFLHKDQKICEEHLDGQNLTPGINIPQGSAVKDSNLKSTWKSW